MIFMKKILFNLDALIPLALDNDGFSLLLACLSIFCVVLVSLDFHTARVLLFSCGCFCPMMEGWLASFTVPLC